VKVERPRRFAVDASVGALRSAGVDVDALGPAPEDVSWVRAKSSRQWWLAVIAA
jgi:hypothetical protein